MLQPRSIQSTLGIKDKILSIDFVLVISILLLGIIISPPLDINGTFKQFNAASSTNNEKRVISEL